MTKQEIQEKTAEFLEEYQPIFPQIGWVPFSSIKPLWPNSKYPSFQEKQEVKRTLEEKPDLFQVSSLRCFDEYVVRRNREEPYPQEIDRNMFRYLLAAYRELIKNGEINIVEVARSLGVSRTTVYQSFGKLYTNRHELLKKTESGRYALLINPNTPLWVWGRDMNRLVTLENELNRRDPEVAVVSKDLPKHVLEGITKTLDQAIEEMEQALSILRAKRDRLKELQQTKL